MAAIVCCCDSRSIQTGSRSILFYRGASSSCEFKPSIIRHPVQPNAAGEARRHCGCRRLSDARLSQNGSLFELYAVEVAGLHVPLPGEESIRCNRPTLPCLDTDRAGSAPFSLRIGSPEEALGWDVTMRFSRWLIERSRLWAWSSGAQSLQANWSHNTNGSAPRTLDSVFTPPETAPEIPGLFSGGSPRPSAGAAGVAIDNLQIGKAI